MGVVDGFKGAGLFAKIAFILLLLAAIFAWIAYTCTGWGEAKNGTHYGLWRRCSENRYQAGCLQLDGWANDWWAATQAMVTFGFFGINVSLFLLILYMFVPSCQKNGEIGMATAIVCIVTGILYMIGVIIFGVNFDDDYIDRNDTPGWSDHKFSYCFALSIIAFLCEIVAGVLCIVDSKKGGTSPSS